MSRLNLYVIKSERLKEAKEVLVDAFEGDPIWEGIAKFSSDRRRCLECFAEMALKYSNRYDEIYAPTSEIEGVMVVTRSKNTYMTFLNIILSGSIFPFMKMEKGSQQVVMTDFNPLEETRKEFMTGEFLYIQAIGVAKEHQGKGFGGKMLRAIIDESNSIRQPIYLETETEENVIMYEKFGFKVVRQVFLDKLQIPIWCMIRQCNG